jgi:hypothetical protein
MKKTKFTQHALMRLNERTSISPQSLGLILDSEEFIVLGKEKDNNRLSKLFFSRGDDQFFIAIQDEKSRDVVTILTIEYWHNLSEKYFLKKLSVTANDLLSAVRIGDPNNEILTHPPLMQNEIFKFTLMVIKENYSFENDYVFVNGGSINFKLLNNTPTEDIANIIKSKFIEKLNNKNISEEQVIAIRWGLGRDLKFNEIETDKKIDYLSLVNAVKNDLYLRNNLFKKYDDFLEILNRSKKIGGNYDI